MAFGCAPFFLCVVWFALLCLELERKSQSCNVFKLS